MTAVVAGAWGVLVLAGFRRWAPAPSRVRRLAPPPRRGHVVVGDGGRRRLVAAVVAGVLTLLVAPPAAPVAALLGWATPLWRRRQRAARARAALRQALPEVVDLLALAIGAGLTVPQAIAAVGRRHDGPIGAELARAADAVARGRRCGDALDDAAVVLGDDVRPVLAALAASDRYGAPLGEALARLASEARAEHRRRAEEAARRVPIKLLFPLVLCVLPAFALLTVAPLLAGALGSLRL